MADKKWVGPWRLQVLVDHPRTQMLVWVRPYRTKFWGMKVTALHYGPHVTRVWS